MSATECGGPASRMRERSGERGLALARRARTAVGPRPTSEQEAAGFQEWSRAREPPVSG